MWLGVKSCMLYFQFYGIRVESLDLKPLLHPVVRVYTRNCAVNIVE